jgi:23S rRNA-/tRNA-specific pseudouridylate synthase
VRPQLEWTVQPGDGDDVGAIVDRLREMGMAEHGRVFLNGRPAALDDPVERGDRVELWPKREASWSEAPAILAHRDGVLLAYKPAGLPTETTQLGEDSLVSALMAQVRSGRVHAASRLDVQVSGVVLCTLGRDAASRVQHWRESGQLTRSYLAIASGSLPTSGSWDRTLGRGRDRAGRHRATPHAQGARPARTRFSRMAEHESEGVTSSLLLLVPETGRMHQLRAHAALAAAPLWGDRLYGGPHSVVLGSGEVKQLDRIALHAVRVELPGLAAEAPPPEPMRALWRWLGGDDAEWG